MKGPNTASPYLPKSRSCVKIPAMASIASLPFWARECAATIADRVDKGGERKDEHVCVDKGLAAFSKSLAVVQLAYMQLLSLVVTPTVVLVVHPLSCPEPVPGVVTRALLGLLAKPLEGAAPEHELKEGVLDRRVGQEC